MQAAHAYPQTAKVIFHSDIHLSPTSPNLTHHYLEHLKNQVVQADALYILGDLFDYWIGPETAELYPEVIACLQSISQSIPVFFMPGNRDFLLSAPELSAWGLQIVPDPCLITHGTKR
jgi:UDP-2,3-diacylglucosamine hydrolase